MLQAGKRACRLFRTINVRTMSGVKDLKATTSTTNDPLEESITRILENANRFHDEHGGKATKSSDILEALSAEILKSDDYFGVKEYFTLEDLFEHKLHLGHHVGLWRSSSNKYLLGARNDLHIFNLAATRQHLWRALNVASHIAFRGGRILFVNLNREFDFLIQHTARQCGQFLLTNKWEPGQLQTLDVKPDLVIITSVSQCTELLRDCAMFNIPTVGLIDSDVDPVYVTYCVPGNDDSSESLTFTHGLFSMAISRAVRLRELALRGDNELSRLMSLEEEAVKEGPSADKKDEHKPGVVTASSEVAVEEELEPVPLAPPTGTVFDWRCKSCENMNAKTNIECIKCSTPKYNSVQARKIPRENVRHWECQGCQAINIKKKKVCVKCKRGKIEDGIATNWECLRCNSWNFKSTRRCISCETPKGQ